MADNTTKKTHLFEEAVKIVNELPKDGPVKPSYDEKLEFYGLYKQATIGKVNTTRPGRFSFDLEGQYKWDAWHKHEKLTSDQAKSLYVEKLIEIVKPNEETEEAKAILAKLE